VDVANDKPADTGTTSGNGTASALAPVPAPGQSGNAPAPVHAKHSVPTFGGNATGRGSKFRFPADTPQGIEERRKDDADRKKAARSVASKMVEPPPLPAAGGSAPANLVAPLGNGEIGQPVASPVEVVVPWQPSDIKEFTDELIELSEAKRMSDFAAVAKEAKLPDSVVREIEADAKFPAKSKAGFKTAVAACLAKWLNRSGISSKNKEEAALIFFGLSIRLQGLRMRAKLDELIQQDKAQKQKAEEKAKAVL
jgi:hypothetical protein